MKRTIILTFLLLGFVVAAQNEIVNIGVIPTPQRVILSDGALDVKGITPRRMHVDSIPGALNQGQAYRLAITSTEIVVQYVSNEGWDYAQVTLAQLRKRYGSQIPCMTIVDWPAYEFRGWLDDISRGPVPNAQFRRKTRSFAQQYKMNFGNYYTEHTLYNDRYPDISAASGIGDHEFANDPYMMANLQCFAHFEKTLRIPFYQSLMDTKANVNPAKEDTYSFLHDQIENAIYAYYSSRFFNINCDETEALGSGRAREYVDRVGSDEVYCKHINRVYDMIQSIYAESHDEGQKMEVLMWGDIVGSNPSMLKKLPKEMQYIVWSYVAKESYADMLDPFVKLRNKQGNAFWVAPGVSHWSSTPQVRNYMQNIAYLSRDGYLAGARGLMNTAWDDSGESLFGDCWHAMAWAAEMAWHPITSTDPQAAREEMAMRERIFNENYDRFAAADYRRLNPDLEGEPGSITQMINLVGSLNSNPWVGDWFNTSALMQPLTDFFPAYVDESMLTRCDSVDALLDRVLSQVDSGLVPHFAYACHRIRCVSEKSRLRVILYKALEGSSSASSKKEVQRLSQNYFKRLHYLKQEYLRLWDEECTDYSRNIICDRYDQLGQEVMDARQKVFATSAFKDGKTMVTLRTLFNDRPIYFTVDGRKPSQGSILYKKPFAISRNCVIKTVSYNKWNEPVYSEQYMLCHKGMGHQSRLNSSYSDYQATYSGGGTNALSDGVLGSDNSYADGHWQGYFGKNIDVEYNFGSAIPVTAVTMRFLKNIYDWILAPKVIEVYTSADGKTWKKVRTEKFDPDFREPGMVVHTDAIRDLKVTTQYLRIVAYNPGPLPEYNAAHGNPSYLFCDEIVID